MTNRLLILAAGAALAAVATLSAQVPAPAFEVASVKRNTSGTNQARTQVLPNGVNLINLPLATIIRLSYGINQPSGLAGPEWINSARFDFIARTATEMPSGDLRGMLQALLAERFTLAAHKEMRAIPGYTLLPAGSDGTLGPNLKPSTVTCSNTAGRGAAAGPPAPDAVPCGPRPGGPGRLILVGSPMQQFASLLALVLGRTVVDRTGLTGRYDLDLIFTPERPPADGAPPDVEERASLFTAVQEQLGLKLQAEDQQIEVLVIDRIEQPAED